MAIQRKVFQNFDFGLSDDERGPEGSFSVGRQIDSRSVPGRLIPNRKLTKESGSVVVSEVHDMVRVSTGEIYGAGGSEIYLRTPGANGAAGTWSLHSSDAALVGVRDFDYNPDLDKLFAFDETEIHELYNVSGTEAWDYSKYSNYLVLNQNDGTTANAYTLLTSVTEGAANIITFTCTAEPLYSVTFNVDAKGASGDWVVTIHDGANRTVGTATVAFANVPAAGSDIEFIFSTPIRLKVGAEYHIHLHATAGTHAVHTATASDLSTADVSTKANRLVNTGEFGHFTLQYGPKTIFCNEHYIGEWEVIDTSDNATAGFDPHRIVLPPECIGVGGAVYNQYVAVACGIRRGSDSTNTKMTNGVIFFWDGVSPNYEFAIEVPNGAPFGLFAQDNVLYWTCEGQLYRWAGGDVEMIFEFPGQRFFFEETGGPTTELYLRGARRCITNWGSLLKVGYPHTVANSLFEIGIFSWGRVKRGMPQTTNFDNIISTGNRTTAFNTATSPDTPITGITCIKRFGSNLLVAWKDYSSGVVYGVDLYNVIQPSAAPADAGEEENCLWLSPDIDGGRPGYKKTALRVIVEGSIGNDVDKITPYIRYDGGQADETGEEFMGVDNSHTLVSMELHHRFRTCRVGFIMRSNDSSITALADFPQVGSVTFEYDDNTEEDDASEDLET